MVGQHYTGRQGGDETREGEHTFQRKLTCATIWETMGDEGRQGETRGDKRTHHPTQAHICGKTMGDNGRQDLGKADAASNTGTHVETMEHKRGRGDKPREDGHTIQHRHSCAETMKGNHPTQAHMWGGNGRREEARPRDGGRTFQRRLRSGETPGDKGKGRQDLGKADAPSVGAHMWGEGDRRKQEFGKVDRPSNTWKLRQLGVKRMKSANSGLEI